MQEEEKFLLKRLIDLSRRVENTNRILYSDFLNMNELDILLQNKKELFSKFELYGGYEDSERQMIAFIPDALSFMEMDREYPIQCIKLVPKNIKFAEKLSHRDILGALMHLGIERKLLGDILVREQESYIFCCSHIKDFIMEELHKVKHTEIKAVPYAGELQEFTAEKVPVLKTITSLRLDCVLSAFLNLSRSEAVRLIQSKQVFINSRNILKTDYLCKETEVIAARGYGKFSLEKVHGETKKGKLKVTFEKFV